VRLMEAGVKTAANVRGSATFCIVALDDASSAAAVTLRVANIGDSGFMVLRDGRLVFRSEEQQHGFNHPFQLATRDEGNAVAEAQSYTLELQLGDVVVVGSDGLFDNVFDETIVAMSVRFGQDLTLFSKALAQLAIANGKNEAKRQQRRRAPCSFVLLLSCGM
jgi:serine/threonine protein phosphatase PrpC